MGQRLESGREFQAAGCHRMGGGRTMQISRLSGTVLAPPHYDDADRAPLARVIVTLAMSDRIGLPMRAEG